MSAKAEQAKKEPYSIDESLQCKITAGNFLLPIILKSGYTYDLMAILMLMEHESPKVREDFVAGKQVQIRCPISMTKVPLDINNLSVADGVNKKIMSQPPLYYEGVPSLQNVCLVAVLVSKGVIKDDQLVHYVRATDLSVLQEMATKTSTLAMVLARNGYAKSLQAMLKKFPMLLDATNDFGQTPAHFAAKFSKAAYKALIADKPELAKVPNKFGITPEKLFKDFQGCANLVAPAVSPGHQSGGGGGSAAAAAGHVPLARVQPPGNPFAQANDAVKARDTARLLNLFRQNPCLLQHPPHANIVSPIKEAIDLDHADMLVALFKQHPKLWKYRIERPAINDVDGYKHDYPVHYAASQGRLNVLRRLIKADSVWLNTKNEFGQTPAHVAAHVAAGDDQFNLLMWLLKQDPQLRLVQNSSGDTVIHIAAKILGRRESLFSLLGRWPDLFRSKNRAGVSIDVHTLGRVVKEINWGCPNTFNRLVDIKLIKPEEQMPGREAGWTWAHGLAQKLYNGPLMRYLKQKPSLYDLKDSRGWTLAHAAASGGKMSNLKRLHDSNKIALWCFNNDGLKPIHIVAQQGDKKSLTYGWKNFPRDVFQERTRDGDSLAQVARKAGHKDFADKISKMMAEDKKPSKAVARAPVAAGAAAAAAAAAAAGHHQPAGGGGSSDRSVRGVLERLKRLSRERAALRRVFKLESEPNSSAGSGPPSVLRGPAGGSGGGWRQPPSTGNKRESGQQPVSGNEQKKPRQGSVNGTQPSDSTAPVASGAAPASPRSPRLRLRFQGQFVERTTASGIGKGKNSKSQSGGSKGPGSS